ncbi:MAG: hypothetical protein M1829_002307 [Trizodia sp. TS-e1964]|nr:MAG: hypothetical protein M1829_002307 [Trizodia sp. TS-e1964]
MHFTSTNGASSALCAFLLAASIVSSFAILPDALRSPETSSPSISPPEPALSKREPRSKKYTPYYLRKASIEDIEWYMKREYAVNGAEVRFQFSEITLELRKSNEAGQGELRRIFVVHCRQFKFNSPDSEGTLLAWPFSFQSNGDASLVMVAERDKQGSWNTFTGYMQDLKNYVLVDGFGTFILGLTKHPVSAENLIVEARVPNEEDMNDYELTLAWVGRAKAKLFKARLFAQEI